MTQLQVIETALAEGRLWAEMRSGRWWRVRRNGKTQHWKRDPTRFRIPVKAGLRSYAEITETNFGFYKISAVDPNG